MSRYKSKSAVAHIILPVFLCAATVLVLLSCNDDNEISSRFTLGLITNNPNGLKNIEGFKQEMAELGYIEGETVTYVYHPELVLKENLEKSIREMVKTKVDFSGPPISSATYHSEEVWKCPFCGSVLKW